SVLLPTFGLPISATYPLRCPSGKDSGMSGCGSSMMRAFDNGEHFAYGPFQSHEHGPSDDGKADRNFCQVGNEIFNEREVPIVETVACVNGHTEIVGDLCCLGEEVCMPQSQLAARRIRVLAGVKLNAIGTDLCGGTNLFRLGVDEERHLRNAGIEKACDHILYVRSMRDDIQPTLRRDLLASLRHQRRQIWSYLAANVHYTVIGGQLEIQLRLDDLLQQANVTVGDMAAVLAQVEYDSVGACHLADRCRVNGVGKSLAARVAQRGYVIDVDQKISCHIKV